MNKEIFAIYFPSWHPDKHYEQWYGKGFSEWELLKMASSYSLELQFRCKLKRNDHDHQLTGNIPLGS